MFPTRRLLPIDMSCHDSCGSLSSLGLFFYDFHQGIQGPTVTANLPTNDELELVWEFVDEDWREEVAI